MDYSLFGRQIALSTLGASGQEAIAEARVFFHGPEAAVEFANLCWKNAGGMTVLDAEVASVSVAVGGHHCISTTPAMWADRDEHLGPIEALAFGAAAACEAAQRVLSADPSVVVDFSAHVATALTDRT